MAHQGYQGHQDLQDRKVRPEFQAKKDRQANQEK